MWSETGGGKPRQLKPNISAAKPMYVRLCEDSDEPSSSALQTKSAEPHRAKDLKGVGNPKCKRSKVNVAEPIHARPRAKNIGPIKPAPKTKIDGSMRPSPKRNKRKSRQTELLRNAEESARLQSRTNNANPSRTKLFDDVLGSRCKRSNADKRESNLVAHMADTTEPTLIRLCTSNNKPRELWSNTKRNGSGCPKLWGSRERPRCDKFNTLNGNSSQAKLRADRGKPR